MRASTAQEFCKRKICPDAASLTAYHQTELTTEAHTAVARHLTDCEFCYQEAYFLQRCLPAGTAERGVEPDDYLSATMIPPHLNRLPYDLLGGARQRPAAERILELVSLPRTMLARDY